MHCHRFGTIFLLAAGLLMPVPSQAEAQPGASQARYQGATTTSFVRAQGPPAGRVVTLHGVGDTLIAGTNGGAFVSTDGGARWREAGFVGQPVSSVAITPAGYSFVGSFAGLFVSSDLGASWSQTTIVNSVSHISVISADTLLASTDSTLFASSDGGLTWIATDSRGYSGPVVRTARGFVSGGVSTSDSLFTGWKLTRSLRANAIVAVDSVVYATLPDRSCLGASVNWSRYPLETWSGFLTCPTGVSLVEFDGRALIGMEWGGVFAVDTTSRELISISEFRGPAYALLPIRPARILAGTYAAGVVAIDPRDGSWRPSSAGMNAGYITRVRAATGGLYASVLGYNGDLPNVYRRTRLVDDLSTEPLWTSLTGNQISTSGINDFFFWNDTTGVVATNEGVYRHWGGESLETPGAPLWEKVSVPGDTLVAEQFAFADGVLFAIGAKLWRSVDQGRSWTNTLLPSEANSIVILPAATLLVGTQTGVYLSADSGSTWIPKIEGSRARSLTRGRHGQIVANTDEIYYSTDGGNSFVRTGTAPRLTLDVALAGPNDSVLYAASGLDGLQYSTDMGVSWTDISAIPKPLDIGYRSVSDLHVDDEGLLWVATDVGLFVSESAVTDIVSLRPERVEGTLAVYPNPASRAVTLVIPPVAEALELRLFDLLGRVVHREEIDGSTVSSVTVDVTSLTPGLYLAVVAASNRSWSSKLLVVR